MDEDEDEDEDERVNMDVDVDSVAIFYGDDWRRVTPCFREVVSYHQSHPDVRRPIGSPLKRKDGC